MRRLTGFAIVAVIGIVLFKLLVGLLGLAFSIMWSLLWLAALGLGLYLVLKLISPSTARRVRDFVKRDEETAEA